METKTQKTPKRTARKHYSIRIWPDILKRAKARAVSENRNLNNLIETILDQHV